MVYVFPPDARAMRAESSMMRANLVSFCFFSHWNVKPRSLKEMSAMGTFSPKLAGVESLILPSEDSALTSESQGMNKISRFLLIGSES